MVYKDELLLRAQGYKRYFVHELLDDGCRSLSIGEDGSVIGVRLRRPSNGFQKSQAASSQQPAAHDIMPL